MGNKHKKRQKQKQKKELHNKLKRENLPFVSLCTPTFNRRPFIKQCIKNMLKQTYPLEKMEWVVIDDGTDKVGDIFDDLKDIKVKYIALNNKISLGKKRNLMHKESSGEILIYIDDDDYYTEDRVMHSVTELLKSKKLIAASSIMHVWFTNDPIYKFGPYGINHGTAGTFAFKKELLNITGYNEDACFAEEKEFLHNYSIPMIQLDPFKTILVFNHIHNTVDKRKLIVNGENKFVKKTSLDINHFIKDKDTIDFYTNRLNKELEQYKEGLPENKHDLMEARKQRDLMKSIQSEQINNLKQQKTPELPPNTVGGMNPDGTRVVLGIKELAEMVNNLQEVKKQHEKTIKIQNKKLTEQCELIEELKKNKN